jgi:hypothetical protein
MKLKTLPLSVEDITKVFVDQEHHVDIDIANSELLKEKKIDGLCVYISNMKLKCSFHNYRELDFQTRSELLMGFIQSRSVILCDTLIDAFADVVLYKFAGALLDNKDHWFSEHEINTFVKERAEELEDVFCFCGSVPITLMSFSTPVQEQIIKPMIDNSSLQEVTDTSVVKVNTLSIYTKPDVVDVLAAYSLPFTEQKLYTPQCREMIYEGDSLFNIVTKHGGKLATMSVLNFFVSQEKEEKKLHEETIEKLKAVGE